MQMIIANWKMHSPPLAAFVHEVAAALSVMDEGRVQAVLCPAFTQLAAAQMVLTATPIALGAQNCHEAAEGAFTGEISTGMLVRAGCSHVILGHSERRAHYGESDAQVRAKTQAALAAGLIPVICIGESRAEREAGQTHAVLERQLAGLIDLTMEHDEAQRTGIIIAYEPLWAIGSGELPSMTEIDKAHRFIKKMLGKECAVLYGGSVKPGNAAEILAIASVDGVLVGGASLDGASFASIIAAAR